MKYLYVPWRQKYSKDNRTKPEKKTCPFCEKFSLDKSEDSKNYILKRFKHNVAVLNIYPYNAGHIMVIPNEHKSSLYDLSKETLSEMMHITAKTTQILEDKLKCDAINVGFNLGKKAGAGIPEHLHMHVLPRWEGDTNFMPLLAETKPISFDLNEIYKDLLPHFKNLEI